MQPCRCACPGPAALHSSSATRSNVRCPARAVPRSCSALRSCCRRHSVLRRRCCAGAATPKAARRSSRPTRTIPRTSAASTSRSRRSLPQSLGRTPQFVQVGFRFDRPVRRPRRLRHRPERHRGHAGAARRDGGRRFPITSSRSADRARGRRDAFRSLADLRGRRVATLGGTIAYEILLRPSASTASSPSRTTTTCIRIPTWWSAGSTRCCSTTSSPSARSDATPDCSPCSRAGRDRALRRHPGAGERRAARSRQRSTPARRCATARSSGSSGSGTSGTTISRSCTRELTAAGDRRSAAAARRLGAGVAARAGGDAALPAVAAARRGDHARAVVPVDGARGRRSACCIASGRVYGEPVVRLAADRLRRADARHADPAAAVRALLRPRRRRSGCRRSSPRCSGSA